MFIFGDNFSNKCITHKFGILNEKFGLKDINEHIIEWLIIGNRYQECIFSNKNKNIYFTIDYINDYYNNKLILDNIINEINNIKNIVKRNIIKYRKKIKSVVTDCLIERGILQGKVDRTTDNIKSSDINILKKKIKNKKSNIEDKTDFDEVISFKKYLEHNIITYN